MNHHQRARNDHIPARQAAQRGAVLIFSLILLLMMTTFVVSSVNISNLGLIVVKNAQVEQQLEAAAQQNIEEAISLPGTFNSPSDPAQVTVDGYLVDRARPRCLLRQTAAGYSATIELAPEDNLWEIVVAAEDPASGATVALHQGVKIRQLQGHCD
ncbi:pilus assembly PilX family protein [Endothiovibrio diazotrophicus]